MFVVVIAGAKCRITIMSSGLRDVTMASWFEIYINAAIVEAMCVRFGKKGMIRGIGKSIVRDMGCVFSLIRLPRANISNKGDNSHLQVIFSKP